MRFPSAARERISVASYPFREFIIGRDEPAGASSQKIKLQDFAAQVMVRFKVNKIEPWSSHFRSLDPAYLEEIRTMVKSVGAAIVNLAVDGEHSPYATDREEREKAVAFSKKWIDAACAVSSPSVRTNIPRAKDSEPNFERAAESFKRVADYAAAKNVVVNLENDNPISEDPTFITQLIDRVNNPWLHALPDFANTLVTGREAYAYTGIDAMFARAYNICHIKAMESNDAGTVFRVDMPRTFGILNRHGYKGYCSMEWDSPGDPYEGTKDLIVQTLRYLG